MRAYAAVRSAAPPPPAPAPRPGPRRTWEGLPPAPPAPARGYPPTAYAYTGVAAHRRAAAARVGRRTWLALIGGALSVGALGLLLMLALVSSLPERTGAGRYSPYRPAGIFAVIGSIAANVQAVTGPAPQPDPAVQSAPAPSGDRPAVAAPSADHTIMAPPSVSAALIDEVLASYSSPATGQGAVFYDLGVQYGIDPAYALAFFIHESSAGTKGVARFTNSIGNIRTTPGYRDYEGYRAYDTWAAGIEDWYKLIKELYVEGWGKRTVAQIIPTYAPSADRNDPPSYIANVTNLVDSWQQK